MTIESPAHAARSAARPRLSRIAHVSFPCRDLAEGKRFYVEVLGGALRIDLPTFASITVDLAGLWYSNWSLPDFG